MARTSKRTLTGIILVAGIGTMFLFQNCAKVQVADLPESTALGKASVLNECGTNAEGSKWLEASQDIISENQVCEFGGNLVYNYVKNRELTCVNANVQATGNTSKGAVLAPSGSCNAPNCTGRAQGSTMSSVDGQIKEEVACPDSTIKIEKVYKRLATYKCDQGKDVFVGYSKGDLIGTNGTCPGPAVTATLKDAEVLQGSNTVLMTTTTAIAQLSYMCSDGQKGAISLAPTSTTIKVTQDLSCTVTGATSAGEMIKKEVTVAMKCDGELVKVGQKCENVPCLEFIELKTFPVEVPARNERGTCYYSKLFNAIGNGPSSGNKLSNVMSRIHGGPNAGNTGTPFILGQAQRTFSLGGARVVKLSGEPSKLAPILVDNYLLVGLKKTSDTAVVFSAFGTMDSAIMGTDYITVDNNRVMLTGFGAAGTATVNALQILRDNFEIKKSYDLRIDALDCGGNEELSNTYLIFQ